MFQKSLMVLALAFTSLCLGLWPSSPAEARPVSWKGGWTAMAVNNGDMHSLHVHYTPSRHYSIGLRQTYHRGPDYWMTTAQLNWLVNRWNMPDSQANLYVKSGLGMAWSDAGPNDGKRSAAGFTGIAADWEDRRFFVSYENRFMEAGAIDDRFMQAARVGIAPWIGDYGDIHTWLMLDVEHEPEDEDNITITPLVRLFRGVHLVEAGISNQGDVLFNYVLRF